MVQFALFHSISRLPNASVPVDADKTIERLQQLSVSDSENAQTLALLLKEPITKAIISAVAGNAPFLARLMDIQWPFFTQLCLLGPKVCYEREIAFLNNLILQETSQQELMKLLRIAKQRISLLTAVADIAGVWDVMTVTRHLSVFADTAIHVVTDFLLLQAAMRGEFELVDHVSPQAGSGLLVLAMGKLGAYELNYSSDIDLIVLFDKDLAPYRGARNVQHFFTKFAQDLATFMQERTSDGYVFRTDLRLRPDPRSTPAAVNIHAAITYYETLGQNWERAAMIKARQVAGDPETGEFFERHIIPYIWRKNLDFYAIADIHSIKRQMTIKVGEAMAVGGHNIKLGRGGIREIEFYVQTQQLVWGGRFPNLRTKPTLDTLKKLVELELVDPETAEKMAAAYLFLRRVEHYLQMTHDQQTHSLPEQPEEIEKLAIFLGYESAKLFTTQLLRHCTTVHQIYSDSMEGSTPLSAEGNLVFTGVDPDPDTLKTLQHFGFTNVEAISDIIQNWHRGSRRATRSKISRQILTELVPTILKSLANSANPDNAFFRFDDFLAKLPAGVQIFSLFSARPELLDLLAKLLGSAPALADILGKHPELLDSVLDGDFYEPLADRATLYAQLSHQLSYITDYEASLRYLRQFKSERQFQAGIQLLQGITSHDSIAAFLSDLAEAITEHMVQLVTHEFSATHGTIANSDNAILAIGKLGSRELTFGSDLDLIFLYRVDDSFAMSNGPKSVDARSYFNRLCSRIITAYTMLSKEGSLYEVDTRLRPSGVDGPLAANIEAFDTYFDNAAWTFEFMALTRARVVASSSDIFKSHVESRVLHHLSKSRDHTKLAHDITDMRFKMAAQHATQNCWNLKHHRGGCVDLDFIAQYLLLKYAHEHPTIIARRSHQIFIRAEKLNLLTEADASSLINAYDFLNHLLHFLRLCSNEQLSDSSSPAGLISLLTERFQCANYEELKLRLVSTQQRVLAHYEQIIGN